MSILSLEVTKSGLCPAVGRHSLTVTSIYRLTDSCGWYVVFQSPVQDSVIERIALNAKTGGGAGTSSGTNSTGTDVMLGIASGAHVRLWAFSTHSEPVRRTLVGE